MALMGVDTRRIYLVTSALGGALAGLEAQLKFQDLRLSQMTQLVERDAGRAFDVQQRQSESDQLRAQLEGAKWNLDKTIVRAPADGYVTNVAPRKGARVGITAFQQALRESGWTEGHNVRFDYRWGAGGADRIRSYVASRRCFLPAHQVIE
jgi:multidrug efflux pump subunit AcrA (membrane-fusion protein)